MSYYLIGILIMAVCTYLPRMLPLTFFRKNITSPFIRSLLYYVPYAVLSALTFPSILYATGNMLSAIIGTTIAMYFAYKDKGLVFVAIIAMLCVYIVSLIQVLI